jgi:hypothetical protein
MSTARAKFAFLDDYCPQCNPLGHHADRPARLAALTEPTSVTWSGGKHVVCTYQCASCGHDWQRGDLWTPEQAGLKVAA